MKTVGNRKIFGLPFWVPVFAVLLFTPVWTTGAAEADMQEVDITVSSDPHYSEFVRSLLNNQYLLENIRLTALAEETYAEGLYDDAAEYAREAIRFAEMSDEYVSQQVKAREATNAIGAARFRLEWARRIGAVERYAEIYGRAETSFSDAVNANENEEWDSAITLARQVVSILSELPDTPALPARFVVRTWASTRDCLWNIAALPDVFGDPWKWPLLYEANRDIMPQPGNPDLIHPGMVLVIPSIAGELRSGTLGETQ